MLANREGHALRCVVSSLPPLPDAAMPALSARQQLQATFLAACGFAVFCFGIRLGYQLVHRLLLGA